jgi:hypothetical protein
MDFAHAVHPAHADAQAGATPTTPGTSLHAATVTGRAGKWLFLDSPAERALRAESCLLEPETGDLVLVCAGLPALPAAAGVAAAVAVPYVLAVLTRPQTTSARLTLPGGASFETTDGELRLSARHIAFDAHEKLSADTRDLEFNSVTTKLVSQHAQTRIGVVDAGIGRLTLVAQSFMSTVGRLVQRAKESSRWVESTDELRAGSTRWRVTGHAHMHTRHTTLQSDEMTRIDGSKIELG